MHRKGHLNLFLWHTCLDLLASWMVVIWIKIRCLLTQKTSYLRPTVVHGLTSALSLIWWNMQPLKEGTTQRFAIKPYTRSFWFVSLLCFTGYVLSRRGFFVVKGKYTVTSSFWLSHMYVVIMSGMNTGMLLFLVICKRWKYIYIFFTLVLYTYIYT